MTGKPSEIWWGQQEKKLTKNRVREKNFQKHLRQKQVLQSE